MRTLGVALVLLSSEVPAEPGGATINGTVDISDDSGKMLPIDNVFVYVVPVHQKGKFSAAQTATIVQKDQQFAPHVVVIPTGSTVEFPNLDRQEHNVFSPADIGGFDLKTWGGPTPKDRHPHLFDTRGAFEIYCDIHKEMWAVVKVVDSVYIAPVDSKGSYSLTDIPDGEYKVMAWMPYGDDGASDRVTIKNGSVTRQPGPVHLHPGQRPNRVHKDKRTPYESDQYIRK